MEEEEEVADWREKMMMKKKTEQRKVKKKGDMGFILDEAFSGEREMKGVGGLGYEVCH